MILWRKSFHFPQDSVKPDKKEFNGIVLSLAKKHGIDMDDKEILAKANMWELSHGGMSGRSATQFITYLQGQK